MENREFYFSEPRLEMTVFGRLVVRLVIYATYAFLVVSAAVFLASDLSKIRFIGVLLALFLLGRIRRFRKSEQSLVRLPEGRLNAADFLSPAGFSVLEWAVDRASLAGGNLHLYIARRLINRGEIRNGLLRMDVKAEEMAGQIEVSLKKPPSKKQNKEQLLRQVEALMKAALMEACKAGNSQIEPKDIFSALSGAEDESMVRLFKLFDVDAGDLESAMIFSQFQSVFSGLKRLPASLSGLVSASHKIRHRIMNRAWTARPTPFLDQFSEDITDLARLERAGLLIGHEQEYDRLTDVLSRPGRPNALLIGEPGSGKSAIVARLAFQIIKDRVPPPLFDKRLVKLEIGSLVAGAAEEELRGRMKKILDEIAVAGNIVLYIPDAHNLLKTGGQGISAADILVPAIKSGDFSVIGATSPAEYRRYSESNAEFTGVFEPIKVHEITEAQAAQFLVYDSLFLEREYRMTVGFSAIKEAVGLAHKYFRDKLLPASAEDLLKETLADASEKRKKVLTAEDVIAVAEKKINVPIHRAGKAEAEQLLNLEGTIHQRLIDQDEAVSAVARSLREYRSGLSRKGGPIASFLFVGPTGVGKTELSKILAKIQFGSSEMMARFDMSEYQDKPTVNRLLDNVTEAIRQKPYSLILLDEFEKAHPDILNLFLQVFDDGRLTGSTGRAVDFQNTIIIATSNAYSEYIKSEIEKGTAVKALSDQIKKKLTGYFKPELLNRFSNIIVFKPLSPSDIEKITLIQLKELAVTLRETQGVNLEFDPAAAKEVARLGYDPVFGARPLRNAISEKLRGPLAEKILRGEIARGGNIKVVFQNNQFQLKNV